MEAVGMESAGAESAGTTSEGQLSQALSQLFAQLSREPDFDAEEFQAHDAADSLILETAAEAIRDAAAGEVVVIGDRHGALTLGAVAALGASAIRTHQDPLLGERALAQNAERLGLTGSYAPHSLDADLLAGARVVIMQLPRGREALEEIAWAIAKYADPAVRVFAGGRVKHMTFAQNEVLSRYFDEVSAGLGKRKARVLSASVPLSAPLPVSERHAASESPFPKWGADPDISFTLAAFGATFGGPKLDHGSRLLLATLDADPPPAPRRVLDLGSGNGVLAVWAALKWPDAEIIATDQSDAAVRATRATAEKAGVLGRIAIHRADGTEQVQDGWADLVLLNPPFHTGQAVHVGVGQRLIRDCVRVLAPGGELRLVFNTHLAYRSLATQVVGTTHQLARDRTFTVLAALRP